MNRIYVALINHIAEGIYSTYQAAKDHAENALLDITNHDISIQERVLRGVEYVYEGEGVDLRWSVFNRETGKPDITLAHPNNKDEECKLLEDIAELVHGDTYLAELFTPEMVSEIQSRIRNDFPCNLYQDFRDQAAEADSKMDLANSLKRDYDNLETTMNARLNEAREAIAQRQETINKFENRYTESRESLASLLSDTEKLASALSDRELECCQLKAKLYDLEHK